MIPYNKPNIRLTAEDYDEIQRIIESGWVCEGKHVNSLENHFKERFKTKYAFACSSATQGLVCAVKAAGWKHERVAIPVFTWASTLYALGDNIPILCDISPKTWTMLPPDNCDVLMPVDIFGIRAEEYDKPCIYDSAHSYYTKDIGHRGLAEVISLSFTKSVSGMQGGIVLTNNDSMAKEIKELIKLTAKLTEINALVALRSIDFQGEFIDMRQKSIKYYKDNLNINLEFTPKEIENNVFGIIFESRFVRDRVKKALLEAGFDTRIYYEPLYRYANQWDSYALNESYPFERLFVHAASLYDRILCLPTHEVDQDKIIEVINELC